MNRMAGSPLISRALELAEKRLGMGQLCHRLIVSETMIHAWRSGQATMPEYKFLRLIDILTELDPAWTEWDQAHTTKP